MTGLEITTEGEIRLMDFESRTGLPARASLDELELMGGRYFSSKPIIIDGKTANREYVFLDPSGTEQEVIVYKRMSGEKDFMVHLETRVSNKF